MNYQFHIQYLECQKCNARVNCDGCSEVIKAKLANMYDVQNVEINLSEDDLLDCLEEVGVFVL